MGKKRAGCAAVGAVLAILMMNAGAKAQQQNPVPGAKKEALPETQSTARQNPPASKEEESEEPDFAFLSGSAYTQGKNSVQIIHQFAYGTRRFAAPGGHRNEDSFVFFQREEYGITDRWEVDVVTPGQGSRTRMNGATVASDYAFADSLAGIRYRLLDERKAPVTVTMGPQVIFPTGSVPKGTGQGSAGFAWDVAVTKDWRGPLFLYNTFNFRVLPSGKDPTPGSSARFNLKTAAWATTLGIRALEHKRKGNNHDIHLFLEEGGSWAQEVDPGLTVGTRQAKLAWLFSPGLRYGFLTTRKTLTEIGVSFPTGLGPNGPKHGVLIQFQFEKYFTQPRP